MSLKYRRYSQAERKEALSLAEREGSSEAAKKLGIPLGTISCWQTMKRKSNRGKNGGNPESSQQVSQAEKASVLSSGETKPLTKAREKKTAKLYTPSQKAEALEKAEEVGVTEASKQLGMSRFSIYSWEKKAKRAAKGEGEAPTSGPDPVEVEKKRDAEILKMWKKHPGLGPSQIRNQLRREGKKVSVNTVRQVMEDAGYLPPKVRREEHTKRYTAVRPNHLWHLDFVHRYIGRQPSFTFIIIDDCSRYVPGFGVDDAERADTVIGSFELAVERHGRPESVMHDKGSAFWSWRGVSRFTRLLEEMGIDQVVAEHKEWNGKVEVFNGNLHKEFFDKHRFYDVAEMRRRLEIHLHWYNHRRTHHALGGLLVPADRYYGRSEEVLARIESGAGANDGDELGLHDRMLDLFKVVSKDGRPEVWLMGEKIFQGA